ncbi:unnamed protein product [Orchesella dallaii]|uniref:Uncharacterized protein n=1 Tax=Orchesella dallaii TaxID=48710 RepID=A0ABP1R6G8_9HEXA
MCENQTVIQRRKPIVGRRMIQQIAAQELSLVFSNKSECVQVKDDDEEVTLANDGIEEGSTLCYSPVKILPPTDTTVVSNQLSSSSSDDEETFDLLENLKDWALTNQETSEYELYGNIFDEKTSLFSEPCDSALLSIFTYSKHRGSRLVVVPLEEIKCKLEDEGGKSVEVVPQNWLGLPDQEGKVKCHWPPVKNPTKLVTQKRKPGPDWCSYAARILRKYDSYQKARLELPRAEYTSDWSEAEATPKRKRVAIPRRNVTQDLESSADDSSQELRNLRDFPSAPSLVCAGTQNNYGLSAQVESFDTGEQIFGIEEVVEAEKSNNEDISSFAQASTSLPIDSVRLPPMQVSSVANSDQGVLELLRKLLVDVSIIKRTVQNVDIRLQKLEAGIKSSHEGLWSSNADEALVRQPFATVEDFQAFDISLDDVTKESLVRFYQ